MKILWVKTGKLVPVDTGGKIRSYNILRKLQERHDVTFLSYYGGRRDEAYEREVCEHVPGTKAVYTGTRDATSGSWASRIAGASSVILASVAPRSSTPIRRMGRKRRAGM